LLIQTVNALTPLIENKFDYDSSTLKKIDVDSWQLNDLLVMKENSDRGMVFIAYHSNKVKGASNSKSLKSLVIVLSKDNKSVESFDFFDISNPDQNQKFTLFSQFQYNLKKIGETYSIVAFFEPVNEGYLDIRYLKFSYLANKIGFELGAKRKDNDFFKKPALVGYGSAGYNQLYVINQDTNERKEVTYMLRYFFVNNDTGKPEDILPNIVVPFSQIKPYLSEYSIKKLKCDDT
jgi:hypothetical protein